MLLRTRVDEACLSDYALDRRLAGELDEREEAAAHAHLQNCTRCNDRVLTLEAARASFDVPLSLPRKRANANWGLRIGGAAGALAAAAALVLALGNRPSSTTDDVRTKGSDAKLGFYVHHDGVVRAGGPAERVVPGDGLRFVVTTREPRWLVVLSVDGAKRASTYYPASPYAVRVDTGAEVALPASTVLDDTLGPETIYGVFCPKEFPVEPLRQALEVAPNAPAFPPECTASTLALQKEAPPKP